MKPSDITKLYNVGAQTYTQQMVTAGKGSQIPKQYQSFLSPAQQKQTQAQATSPSQSPSQQLEKGFTATSGWNQLGISQGMINYLAQIYGTNPDQMAQMIQHNMQASQERIVNPDTGYSSLWSYGAAGSTPTQQGYQVDQVEQEPGKQKQGQNLSSASQIAYGMLYAVKGQAFAQAIQEWYASQYNGAQLDP